MSIVDIAVKRPVAISMFTFAVLLFGMVSLSRLAVNLLPELSYPTLTIRTDYTGAAPGEVEQLITKPIEETIGVVKGVRSVESTSRAGQSDVVLEFEWGTEMDLASLEVREKLDVLQLPLDVQKPLLLRFNPSLDPIMRYGLVAVDPALAGADEQQPINLDTAGMKRLRTYAEEQLKRKLESVTGVASVRVGGGLENEIQVLIDQQKASQLNIPMSTIVERLKNENVNTSGGRIEDGSQEYLVRTLNEFQTLDDMRDLFIANREGRNIRLGDIANVYDSFKDRDSITRFDGFEGVEIAIYKEGDANTVQVAENVQQQLQRIGEDIPANFQLRQVYDQSRFIDNAISQVQSAAVVGGILAMLVLYLFLQNIWSTVIISVSIPVSVIATFNLMYGSDITLNIMSLGGIALAIGLLVDNSIVVLENIDRHKRQGHKNAAAIGTKEVSSAIVASTLTTMAVFFPLVFVEGIAGQLFSDQALTVTFALAASLVVALTLIPTMAAREQRKKDEQPLDLGPSKERIKPSRWYALPWYYLMRTLAFVVRVVFYYLPLAISSLVLLVFGALRKVLILVFKPLLWLFEKGFNGLAKGYEKLLSRALMRPLLVIIFILGASGGAVPLAQKLGMELIPPMSQGEFYVEVRLPTGSRIDNTDVILASLAQQARGMDGVQRSYSLAGTGSLMNASPSQGGDFWGKLNVVMAPGTTTVDKERVQNALRQRISQMPGVEAKFGDPELFTFSTPLEIEIAGYDLGQLRRYGDRMVEMLAAEDRFVDVKSNLQAGNPELKISFDQAKLAQLGLNAPDVSKLIATKIGGEVATKFSIEDRKVDILVRSQETQRDSVADISQIIVNPGATLPIPLNAVADVQMSIGPSEIARLGQQRVVIVSANLAYGDLGEAVALAKSLIPELDLPISMQAKVAGQNEEMEVSFNSLLLALGLAVFMVYLVMASQFESLLHPFLILFTVPLACAGSVYGLYLTNTPLSVVVFIGLIMLAGIVVNNAIVLIDRINQLRAEGVEKFDAIIEAANNRLRPIFMTTLTTTLGLLPMAIGFGEGAEIRTPMAITVIFGLLFASLLTLLLIPVLYSLFDRKRFAKVNDEIPSTDNASLREATL